MNLYTWFMYVLAVLVLTASPGPSVLLCVSKSVSYGFRSAFSASLGSLTAIVLIMTLSFTGLGVVIATSDVVFSIVKWGGAAYLVFLGIQALRSRKESYELVNEEPSIKSFASHWLSGFIVGASNPKAIVFFTALFPQFIDTQSALLPQYLVFASTFTVLELFWLMFYASLAARSSGWLMKPGRAKRFNQLTGGVFIAAGVLLSTSSRASTA